LVEAVLFVHFADFTKESTYALTNKAVHVLVFIPLTNMRGCFCNKHIMTNLLLDKTKKEF